MHCVHENVFSEYLKESLLMAGSLRLSDNQFHIAGPADHRKSPPTITAETMARHNEKTSAGRAKMLSGDRLAEVDKVLFI